MSGTSEAGTLSVAFRLARRELRGGLAGFRIFLACLILGVAAIAAVQSVSSGIIQSLRDDGRAILGGDVALRTIFQPVTPDQRAFLDAEGRVSVTAEMRAMARVAQNDAYSLVELKAVDDVYPLFGRMELVGGGDLEAALAQRDGTWGAVVEDSLADRLGVAVGDQILIGTGSFELRAVIAREPDRAGSGGFSLGPRFMIALDALPDTGLLQPGSMIEWNYRLDLPPETTVAAWRERLDGAFPTAGWRIRDFTDASPRLQRFIDRLTLFLTLVGLTALLVGGVGVGNAVRSYLDGRTGTIATLKCIGAPARVVFATYLIQILALSCVGIAIGLVIGACVPLIVEGVLRNLLPVGVRIGVYPGALAIAAGFGLLTALTFSLWPLARAQEVPPGALFRDRIAPITGRPRPQFILATALSAAGLAALAILTAEEKGFAAAFVGGAAATMLAFRLAGTAVVRAAGRIRRPRSPGLRLAVANLHRPGNPTGSVVLSLGLGLTVLVAIALVEGNFAREVSEGVPEEAPAFFFIDIQPDQLGDFAETVAAIPGTSGLETVPSLRGRIVAANGVDAETAMVNSEHSWVTRGDRGVTYAAEQPEDMPLLSGRWWAPDYAGPPLISIYSDIAEAFAIGVGDTLTVNILGRDITAEVASVRDIDWGNMTINFTMIFSPGVLDAAPQTFIATVRATPDAEPLVQRRVTERFANITTVRVKDALDTVADLLRKIGAAVRVTAAVTLVAGTLVLAGAIAAGHRRRVYDSVVLKVLGATRFDILKAFLVEYGLLGILTAMIAALVGTVTAWAVLTQVMEMEWTFLPSAVVWTATLSTFITLTLGFLGTWRALGQPAAPLLRND